MKKILSLYLRHRALTTLLLASVVVMCVLYFPQMAHAQADTPEFNSLLNDVNQIFSQIIGFLASLFWPVILMIGSLLDNDLIFGGAMGERLLAVWVQIRNLVNIIFVLILLAIAVYNVLGLGEEGGLPLAFKTALPKFVLALIAVNFSFIGIKVVLDFTNVLTGAVFALPTTTTEQPLDISKDAARVICGTQSDQVSLKPLWCDGVNLNEKAQNFFARLDRTNITVAYAIRFTKTPQLKFIRNGIEDISQLGFNIIFNAALFFVYAISFIVLFLVLLFRLVVLWVAVVLSPLLALTIVLPNLKELAGEGGKIQEQFVKNAIAPITIGLVLSVGYIMLDGLEADKTLSRGFLSSSTLQAIDPNAIPTDINDLQQLMIAIAVIAIVWVGVFAATSGTAAAIVTDSIKEYAGGFAKWVGKLPTYAQVLPVGEKYGGKAAIQELLSSARHVQSIIQDKYGSTLFKNMPGGTNEISKAQNGSQLAEKITKVPYEMRHNWGTFLAKLSEFYKEDGKTFAEKHAKGYSLGAMKELLENQDKFPEIYKALKGKYESKGARTPSDIADEFHKDVEKPPEAPAKAEPKKAFKDETLGKPEDVAAALLKSAGHTPEELRSHKVFKNFDPKYDFAEIQTKLDGNSDLASSVSVLIKLDTNKEIPESDAKTFKTRLTSLESLLTEIKNQGSQTTLTPALAAQIKTAKASLGEEVVDKMLEKIADPKAKAEALGTK